MFSCCHWSESRHFSSRARQACRMTKLSPTLFQRTTLCHFGIKSWHLSLRADLLKLLSKVNYKGKVSLMFVTRFFFVFLRNPFMVVNYWFIFKQLDSHKGTVWNYNFSLISCLKMCALVNPKSCSLYDKDFRSLLNYRVISSIGKIVNRYKNRRDYHPPSGTKET